MTSHSPRPAAFSFHADDLLGQYLNHYPQSLDWFRERGLEPTHSGVPLRTLLGTNDPSADLLELALRVVSEPTNDDPDELCGAMTIDELVDHICTVHHAPTRAELGRMALIAEALRRSQSAPGSGWFQRFVTLRRDLLDHLDEEEALLFPACRVMEQTVARRPISTEACNHELTVMEHGHHEVGHQLAHLLHELTQLNWPHGDEAKAQALRRGLGDLKQDLIVHSYKEEEYLLPAAIHADELYDSRQRFRTHTDAADTTGEQPTD